MLSEMMSWYPRVESGEWGSESWSSPPPPKKMSDFSIDAILATTSPASTPSSLQPSPPIHYPNGYPTTSHFYNYPRPLADSNIGRGERERAWSEESENSANYPRKQRTVYHQYQIRKLEESFMVQQYMVGSDRIALSLKLGLTETQVRVWFQNRRSKWRKEMREVRNAKPRPYKS